VGALGAGDPEALGGLGSAVARGGAA